MKAKHFIFVFSFICSTIFTAQDLSDREEIGAVLKKVVYEGRDKVSKRIFIDIELDTKKYGVANFTISLPEGGLKEKQPVMIVIAGRETGRKSLQFVPFHNNFAVIAYEYPKEIKEINQFSHVFFKILQVRDTILNIPYQLLSIAKWCQTQKWSDENLNPSFLGFSFGTIFVPPAYHYAQEQKFLLGPGVLGYGGADLYCLLRHNMPSAYSPKWAFARFFAWLYSPLEPSRHLPYIKNTHFLIMNGVNDKQIPFACAKRLQELVPEPKTIVNLKTDHLNMDNPALIEELAEISRQWIKRQLQLKKEGLDVSSDPSLSFHLR
ncbi:MAG: hypothetical protein Tsb0015_01560 [Simkaniaceae bacterium]